MASTEDIGHILKRARKEQGLTQSELAEKAGVTRRTISNIENGATTGQPRIKRILGEALGVDLAETLGVDDVSVKTLLRAIEPILEAIPPSRRPSVMSQIIQILSNSLYEEQQSSNITTRSDCRRATGEEGPKATNEWTANTPEE